MTSGIIGDQHGFPHSILPLLDYLIRILWYNLIIKTCLTLRYMKRETFLFHYHLYKLKLYGSLWRLAHCWMQPQVAIRGTATTVLPLLFNPDLI